MGPSEDSGGCCERVRSGAEDRLLSRVAAPYLAGFAAARMIYEEFEVPSRIWPAEVPVFVQALKLAV
jgi:hypothetical protein